MRHLLAIGISLVVVLLAFMATFAQVGAPTDAASLGFGHIYLHVKPQAGTGTYQSGYSPQQIRGAYGLAAGDTGAGVTIAIVDAYDDPTAAHDFDVFSRQFGLPTIAGGCGCFTKVNQTGGTKYPRTNGGWAEEISLDIEWAHAIAPAAKILLVEATTNSNANLYAAEDYAAGRAQVVSNSWGGNETSKERKQDSHFNHPVAITVSAGDGGSPAQYPSSSPDVLSIGGTSLTVKGSCGTTNWAATGCTYGGETAWSNGGGGVSKYESEPAYQQGYCGTTADVNNCGGKRGTPDLAWVGDPNTGVAVFDSTCSQGYCNWLVFGGTSVGAPSVAGVIADADALHGATLTTNDLTSRFAYQNDGSAANYGAAYHDVTRGSNGTPCCSAGPGYDFTTGLGSPNGAAWLADA